jgi:hypothetical protein
MLSNAFACAPNAETKTDPCRVEKALRFRGLRTRKILDATEPQVPALVKLRVLREAPNILQWSLNTNFNVDPFAFAHDERVAKLSFPSRSS